MILPKTRHSRCPACKAQSNNFLLWFLLLYLFFYRFQCHPRFKWSRLELEQYSIKSWKWLCNFHLPVRARALVRSQISVKSLQWVMASRSVSQAAAPLALLSSLEKLCFHFSCVFLRAPRKLFLCIIFLQNGKGISSCIRLHLRGRVADDDDDIGCTSCSEDSFIFIAFPTSRSSRFSSGLGGFRFRVRIFNRHHWQIGSVSKNYCSMRSNSSDILLGLFLSSIRTCFHPRNCQSGDKSLRRDIQSTEPTCVVLTTLANVGDENLRDSSLNCFTWST